MGMHFLKVPSEPRTYEVTVRFRVREGPFDRDDVHDDEGPMIWRKRHSVAFVRTSVKDAVACVFGLGLRKRGPLVIDVHEVPGE
jgi:hypothetical protein